MEIYNFAVEQPKKHFSFPELKIKRTHNTIVIPKVFSVRSFLIYLGGIVSTVFDKTKKNSKVIIISLLSVLFAVCLVFGSSKIYFYSQTHASPLTLSELQDSEISRLDKMMADFAIENYAEVNESGDIKDAVITATELFTQPVTYQTYKVLKGDSVSGIAKKFGLSNISTLISVNDIGNARALAAGQKLKIPSIDGILYTVKSGDSIASLASKNSISVEAILDVNDLSSEILQTGQILFLPGAKLDQKTLSLAMGDQFINPIKSTYHFSSRFGWRDDPISGKRSYHKGDDLACPTGTPFYASLSGKVIYVGESWLYGKHIIIDHGNGYQTLYAHASKIIATKGQWVSQGTRIGLVGSTGYSTGPHLHFTVYKNGNPVSPSSVLKY